MTTNEEKPRLFIRNANLKDIPDIIRLTQAAYPGLPPYTPAHLQGHMQNFPEGQFVAVYDNKIVGYCATIRVPENIAFAQHSWREITGGGYGSRHSPVGEWLYGMDVSVDPSCRGLRIGRRLYSQRKNLCRKLGLKGIVFGGRLPGLSRRWKKVQSVEEYVEQVKKGTIRDQVLSFQLQNGFEIIGILKDYLPGDTDSMGYATHLVWRNPRFSPEPIESHIPPYITAREFVRVAVVQYQQRRVTTFEEFGNTVEYFIDVVADYKADFVLFPEFFTLQLLSIKGAKASPKEAMQILTEYLEPLKSLMSGLAIKYNINIIGGTHPSIQEDGRILNICHVFLRDGSMHHQEKIHPTPNEKQWWQIEGGNDIHTIMTDCGPIGILICYDCEFPEMSRHLIDQGARILFVPFCTDERQAYMRIRYCAQARAIENQCYVALAGNVGNLPNVINMDIQYAQSCILTPCDFPFARDGVAADTTPNVEMVAFTDLNMLNLAVARSSGAVQNLKDRRYDLYSVNWAIKNRK
jgi:predicted amidohydrolase/ribosomal protein S18 acetylase RimI-like enzyme